MRLTTDQIQIVLVDPSGQKHGKLHVALKQLGFAQVASHDKLEESKAMVSAFPGPTMVVFFLPASGGTVQNFVRFYSRGESKAVEVIIVAAPSAGDNLRDKFVELGVVEFLRSSEPQDIILAIKRAIIDPERFEPPAQNQTGALRLVLPDSVPPTPPQVPTSSPMAVNEDPAPPDPYAGKVPSFILQPNESSRGIKIPRPVQQMAEEVNAATGARQRGDGSDAPWINQNVTPAGGTQIPAGALQRQSGPRLIVQPPPTAPATQVRRVAAVPRAPSSPATGASRSPAIVGFFIGAVTLGAILYFVGFSGGESLSPAPASEDKIRASTRLIEAPPGEGGPGGESARSGGSPSSTRSTPPPARTTATPEPTPFQVAFSVPVEEPTPAPKTTFDPFANIPVSPVVTPVTMSTLSSRAQAQTVAQIRSGLMNGVLSLDRQTVIIEGVVTFGDGGFVPSRSQFNMQDDTGGIAIDDFRKQGKVTPTVGDRVRVSGRLGAYRGMTQLVPTSPIEILERGISVAPEYVQTAGQFSEMTEGKLMGVRNARIVEGQFPPRPGNSNLRLTLPNGDEVRMFIDTESGISGPTPQGKISVVGVLYSWADSETDTNFRWVLYPRGPADIIVE